MSAASDIASPSPSPVVPADGSTQDDSSSNIIRLRGTGSRIGFLGLYNSYDSHYPSELSNVLSEHEFDRLMDEINEGLIIRSPCLTCTVLQYLCCPCTLGLSLACVRCMCLDIARRGLEKDLSSATFACQRSVGLGKVEWRLKETAWDSWIEIEIS